MSVEDVFSITGRGTVATGRIERGRIKVGEGVEIVGIDAKSADFYCNRCGNVPQDYLIKVKLVITQVYCSVVLKKPRSVVVWLSANQVLSLRTLNFKCEVYVLSKEEGGRHTPFFQKYRPQFYFRTTDVTGEVEFASRY